MLGWFVLWCLIISDLYSCNKVFLVLILESLQNITPLSAAGVEIVNAIMKPASILLHHNNGNHNGQLQDLPKWWLGILYYKIP